MRYKLHLIFLLFSIVWTTTSCSDDEGVFPIVNIESINQNASFDFGDTIVLVADINDKEGAIVINILDGDIPKSTRFRIFDIVDNRYTFWIFLEDKYLPTKSYDIRVSAFNGDNKSSDFQNVFINELPRRIRGLSYVAKTSIGSSLYKIDSVGIRSQINLATYDFGKVASDNRNGRVVIAPDQNGPVEAYEFGKMTLLFSTALSPIASVFYEKLDVNEDQIYAFLTDGRVMSYFESGGSFERFTLPDNYLPKVVDFSDDRIIIGAKQQGTSLNKLFLLRKENSFVLTDAVVNAEVKAVQYFAGSTYFFTYQKNGQAVIAEFNSSSGFVSERYFVDDEVPSDLVISGNSGFLSTDKAIYEFNPSQFQFPAQLFGFGVTKMIYDDLNNELYFTNGSTIWKAPLGSNQNQFVTSSSEEIMDFTIVYNK